MSITEGGPRNPIRHHVWHDQPRQSWYNWLVGRPLATADAEHQTINKIVGLAVFASDALSSTAYATQEILVILAAAGTAAFGLSIPMAVAIVCLLAIVTLSYEQTIHAYPGGGGAYIVARDNLGEMPAQIAGASLLMDYVLTVAVSVASGVAQLVSGVPSLYEYTVPLCVGVILFVMVVNLRGIKESGTIFAFPTYCFMFAMYSMVGVGLFKLATGHLGTVPNPPHSEFLGAAAVTPFLILRAFSSGTSALTGVEAISNGITAFREPRTRNAGITLLWMAFILGSLFFSITWLSHAVQAMPSERETVISQLARTAFGDRGVPYWGVISVTTLILVLAANTSFAGFPWLAAIMAQDGFVPRQFAFRGSRLVFSRGIVVLALLAILLVVLFHGSVTALIPLYAIGVFLSFTLSQAGMARRWLKIGRLAPGQRVQERGSVLEPTRGWRGRMLINGLGAVCTAVVCLVFAVTKFTSGAYVVLILLPVLVLVFSAIHRHYMSLAGKLSLERYGEPPLVQRHRVIVPISGLHRGTLTALRYARALTDDVTAVHVSVDPDDSERLKRKWQRWGGGTRLVILTSSYRLLLEPLLVYVRQIAQVRQPNETITVVVPQFVPSRWWHNVLHTQAAFWLRLALLRQPGIVVTDVPYLVDEQQDAPLPHPNGQNPGRQP